VCDDKNYSPISSFLRNKFPFYVASFLLQKRVTCERDFVLRFLILIAAVCGGGARRINVRRLLKSSKYK